jgi:hypothetical protein
MQPSISMANSTGVQQSEDGMSFVLNAVKYKEHCWQLSDVLKIAKFY